MADISMEPTYALRLTRQEFRLIGLGLVRNLKSKKDVSDAKELNKSLLERVCGSLREQLQVMEGAKSKVEGSVRCEFYNEDRRCSELAEFHRQPPVENEPNDVCFYHKTVIEEIGGLFSWEKIRGEETEE